MLRSTAAMARLPRLVLIALLAFLAITAIPRFASGQLLDSEKDDSELPVGFQDMGKCSYAMEAFCMMRMAMAGNASSVSCHLFSPPVGVNRVATSPVFFSSLNDSLALFI